MTEINFAILLRSALQDEKFVKPKDIANELLSADIARYLDQLEIDEIIPLLEHLPLEQRAEAFVVDGTVLVHRRDQGNEGTLWLGMHVD